ncbi:phage head closure protein [Limosilactobacillus fermentum]|uniref:phage head closure protein n=1 Tax=Limosilactobacillus fermentum TaxID=1613 RepID=UPI003B98092E
MAMPKTVEYSPYLFNEIADFGVTETVTNPYSGVNEPSFVKSFSLHVYPQKRTLNMQYRSLGTNYVNAITLVVRHNNRLNDQLRVKYKGEEYKILNISSDDSANYMTYDFLTLQNAKELGGNG